VASVVAAVIRMWSAKARISDHSLIIIETMTGSYDASVTVKLRKSSVRAVVSVYFNVSVRSPAASTKRPPNRGHHELEFRTS